MAAADFYRSPVAAGMEPIGRPLHGDELALGELPTTHTFAVEETIPEFNTRPHPLAQFQRITEDSRPICPHYVRGRCNRGDQCRFRHDMSRSHQKKVVCTHWYAARHTARDPLTGGQDTKHLQEVRQLPVLARI